MINFVNRVISIVVLLVLSILLIAVAVTPDGVARFGANLLGQVDVNPISVERLIVSGVCAVLAVIFLWLLGQEFRRERLHAVPLASTGKAAATTIAAESVVQRLRSDVEQVPGVRQVNPIIRGGGRGVNVLLEVRTDPDVDVPGKAEEIDQVARESMSRLGVRLDRLRVKLHVARGATSTSTPTSQ